MERFMLVILGLLIIFVLLGTIGFRLFIEITMARVTGDQNQTTNFKKKAAVIKRYEQRKHLSWLIKTSFFTVVYLVFLLLAVLIVQANVRMEKIESDQVVSQLKAIRKDQEKVLSETSSTFSFNQNNAGEERDVEKNKNNRQEKIEAEISTKITHFFNVSHLNLSIDDTTRTVTISFNDQTDGLKTSKEVKRDVKRLMKEFEDTLEFEQIQLRLTIVWNKENGLIYNANYIREKDGNSFKKINDFERPIKLGGERG